jgi:CelD/BcsL family acetyltransferase involved in cellulose biosynthesis
MITVISEVRAFQAMREPWNALLDASESSNPFLTWEWMSTWWTHLRGAAALHIVTVHSGTELIAIAPLVVVRRGLSLQPRLEFLGAAAGGADYLDVIVRQGHASEALAALSVHLGRQQMALHLDRLPPKPLAAALQRAMAAGGWTALETSPDVCPYVELAGRTWDSYLQSLGSSHRANFRRRLRALETKFSFTFTPVTTDEERRRVTDALFLFHDQRFTECGGSTAFSTMPLRAFHEDLTRQALAQGWLRMYALSLDDTVAGAMYGFARNGRFYFYQHGFDAAYTRYSVGLVLMGLTIRAAIDEGMREFDMLYGHEAYKNLWARSQRPLGRLMLFPPRLAGRWLQRRAETRQAVRALIHRLGLKGSHDAA